MEDETSERVYISDEDDYVLRPKDNTKDIIKTKTETKAKSNTDSEISVNLQNNSVEPLRGWSKAHGDNNIYNRFKYECKECQEEFWNKIALTTHSYGHNCRNRRDEAINNTLEEIKNCYQYRKIKSFK